MHGGPIRSTRSGILVAALAVAACGARQRGAESPTVRELREAIHAPVHDAAQSEAHSRLIERVIDEGALENLHRSEVEAALGRGARCSAVRACIARGFGHDDWIYDVGVRDGSITIRIPALIVGFDHEAMVTRTYVLRSTQ